MEKELTNYNQRIKSIRNSKNIKQETVAKYLGILQQQYARYENGINVMPVSYLKGICECLDISANYIIGLIDEARPLKKLDNKESSIKYYNERIKWIRDCDNIKLKDISLYLGIKPQQFRRYEKGINNMPITHLKKICEYLNVDADYIIGLTNTKEP